MPASHRAIRRRWNVAIGLLALGSLLVITSTLAVDLNLAVATVRLSGPRDQTAVGEVKQALAELQGYRRSRLEVATPREGTTRRLEIEFQAISLTDATIRLWKWQESLQPPVEMTIEHISFRPLRLQRRATGFSCDHATFEGR